MTAKHTPGPWKVWKSFEGPDAWGQDYYSLSIHDMASMSKIATVESWHGKNESAESERNADLMAAAPDLLAALISACGRLEALEATHYHGPSATVNICRAAISRARGTP